MDAALTEAVESKSYDMLGDLEKRVSQLAADRAELKQAEATAGWGPCFRVARWRSLLFSQPGKSTSRGAPGGPGSVGPFRWSGCCPRAASGRPRVSPRSHLAIE
jgi:hypothetical protein